MIHIDKNSPEGRAMIQGIFAVNHYISTGDYIGEGAATEDGLYTRLIIPYRTTHAEDFENWNRLEAAILSLIHISEPTRPY